jgi:hypothetical protein
VRLPPHAFPTDVTGTPLPGEVQVGKPSSASSPPTCGPTPPPRGAGANFDFTGSEFTAGTYDFSHAQFTGGTVTFNDAEFTGRTVTFNDAEFSGGTVSFYDAQFTGGDVGFALVRVLDDPVGATVGGRAAPRRPARGSASQAAGTD